MIVVATNEEYEFVKKFFPEKEIIKTGVGALNVIHTLKDLPRDTPILNYGLAGSNIIPKGTVCAIAKSKLYHPVAEFDDLEFDLDCCTDNDIATLSLPIDRCVTCYTSNDFVTQTDMQEPIAFDMELAYILALGFTHVKSIKKISDALNLEEYTQTASE